MIELEVRILKKFPDAFRKPMLGASKNRRIKH